MKETTAMVVPKEMFVYKKDDEVFAKRIADRLSHEIAERIINILNSEGEVIVKQSDVIVTKLIQLNQVEYRRLLNWEHLVRCKECKYGQYDSMLNLFWCDGKAHTATWFCAGGDRRE